MLGENAIDRVYGAVETIRERFGAERFELPPAVESIVEESAAYYEPVMSAETAGGSSSGRRSTSGRSRAGIR